MQGNKLVNGYCCIFCRFHKRQKEEVHPLLIISILFPADLIASRRRYGNWARRPILDRYGCLRIYGLIYDLKRHRFGTGIISNARKSYILPIRSYAASWEIFWKMSAMAVRRFPQISVFTA